MPSLAKIVPKMPFRRIQIEGIVQGFKHRWRTKLALYLGEGNMYDGIDNLATHSKKKLGIFYQTKPPPEFHRKRPIWEVKIP